MTPHTLQLAVVIFSRENTEKYSGNTEPSDALNYGTIQSDIRIIPFTIAVV